MALAYLPTRIDWELATGRAHAVPAERVWPAPLVPLRPWRDGDPVVTAAQRLARRLGGLEGARARTLFGIVIRPFDGEPGPPAGMVVVSGARAGGAAVAGTWLSDLKGEWGWSGGLVRAPGGRLFRASAVRARLGLNERAPGPSVLVAWLARDGIVDTVSTDGGDERGGVPRRQ